MTALDTAPERARLALARPDLLREAAWIGGRWVAGGEAITVENPANGRALGTVPSLGAAETRDAVAAAEAAFAGWKARPPRSGRPSCADGST